MVPTKVKRYGQLIGLKREAAEQYVKYHTQVWPEVLRTIRACNIRNYSIFLKDDLLFAYFEYVGSDFVADMAKMAADAKTQEWWSIMKPMQQPVSGLKEGAWWADMVEVFHTD